MVNHTAKNFILCFHVARIVLVKCIRYKVMKGPIPSLTVVAQIVLAYHVFNSGLVMIVVRRKCGRTVAIESHIQLW